MHDFTCTRYFLTALMLFATLCEAQDRGETDGPGISENRYYLESACPAEGIQELLLRPNRSFLLSTFIPKTRDRGQRLEGEWELKDDRLYLHADGKTLGFRVKSRVHQLLGEKFLYLSFRALATPQAHFLADCEFVDRRVVSHFLHKNKPGADAALPVKPEEQ